MSNNIDTIYLDLDGVICDFRKGCERLGAIEGYVVDWEKVHAEGSLFWAELEWTEDGQKFYNWLERFCDEQGIDLCILSQVAYQDGIDGKYEWLRNNTRIPNKNIYIVKTGKAKSKFACPNALLIDDFGKNVEHFILGGGKAIKFNNAKQAKTDILDVIK